MGEDLSPQGWARGIITELAASGDVKRAEGEKNYLKSRAIHLGVRVPAVRLTAKKFLAAHGDVKREELIVLLSSLWASQVHEARLAAAEIMKMRANLLVCGDAHLIEEYLRTSLTWALVDNLSTGVSALLWERYPEYCEVLDRWAEDGDFWVRRAALLTLLPSLRSGGGDFSRFGRYAVGMLGEKEFFIRKAIGWVLRDTSRKRPELVAAWVAAHKGEMSGLTFREAVRTLPDDRRRSIGPSR